tara:strand:- start:318 stop:1118 length:801 start_codon:yes stop_codon:yes gene_type:complete
MHLIDMHSHVLHRIDDGSASLETSKKIIDDAVNAGWKTMFATSHFIAHDNSYRVSDLHERLIELNKYIRDNSYDFEIILGHEILLDHNLLNHLEEGKALTLGGSRYLLIEFPMYDIPVYTDHILHELKVAGYIPIIAHPERNMRIIEDPNRLFDMLEKGAFAQLNLKSLTGKFGKSAQNTAEILLKHNMYHFVGSDVHRPTNDKMFMGREINKLKELTCGRGFDELIYGNPYAVLIDAQTISSNHKKVKVQKLVEQLFRRFRRNSA